MLLDGEYGPPSPRRRSRHAAVGAVEADWSEKAAPGVRRGPVGAGRDPVASRPPRPPVVTPFSCLGCFHSPFGFFVARASQYIHSTARRPQPRPHVHDQVIAGPAPSDPLGSTWPPQVFTQYWHSPTMHTHRTCARAHTHSLTLRHACPGRLHTGQPCQAPAGALAPVKLTSPRHPESTMTLNDDPSQTVSTRSRRNVSRRCSRPLPVCEPAPASAPRGRRPTA